MTIGRDDNDLPTVRLVYACATGFITDFGQPLEMKGADGAVVMVERFGVWKQDPAKGKGQLTLTTNDLTVAKQEAER